MHFPDRPVSVSITTREGERLEEYKQVLNGDETTCYIESRPGEEWRIRLGWEEAEGQRGEYDYHGVISVDGKPLEKTYVRLGDPDTVCYGVRSRDAKSIRPFVFQTLAVGDSDDEEVQQLDEATVRALGSIVVELRTGRYSAPIERKDLFDTSMQSINPLMVHEKMKKKTSEVTTLGDARERAPSKRVVSFAPADPPRSFTFTFLYRSAALLELEDIVVEGAIVPIVAAAIPAPPAGPPPAVWDPVAAEAECHRLQAEMAALPANPAVKIEGKRAAEGLNSAAKKIKMEAGAIVISDNDDDDEEVPVKREVKKEIGPRVKKQKGSTIDLTSED